MYFRVAFALLASVATLQRCAAAPKVVTVNLPVYDGEEEEGDISVSQGGAGPDGRTTYVVADVTPTASAALSTWTPHTGTWAIGASDVVYQNSWSDVGAVTESCGWGSNSLATCVQVFPATYWDSASSGTVTVTTASLSVVPTPITVAEPTGSSSSSPSGSSRPLPGSSGASVAPAPSQTTSSASRTLATWSGMLAIVAVGMSWAM